MASLVELGSDVATSYDRLGMPSWSNPHPDATSPREEEYSRVTASERYVVVHARARVWADRLREEPGVRVEALTPQHVGDDDLGVCNRGVRLTSVRPDTLSLLLLESDGTTVEDEEPPAVLQISVVRPEIVLQTVPNCGCDACDLGSDHLLHTIDETIGHVVGSPLVVLRGKDWQATWRPGGFSAGGAGKGPDYARVEKLCRRLAAGEDVRLPRRTEAFVGRPWLT